MVKKDKRTKTTPWIKIKAEYLQGATPKELAKKYKLTAKQVNDKASRNKWAQEKSEIRIKTHENIEEKIKAISTKALNVLEEIVENPESKDSDRVSAAKAILDVSGLKSSKQEITGKDGAPLAIQKVFVTEKQQKAVKQHIQDVINGRKNI